MRRSLYDFAKLLYEIKKTVPEKDLSVALQDYILLLQKERFLLYLNKILDIFSDYFDEQEGIIHISVLSAKPLTQDNLDKIIAAFQKKYPNRTFKIQNQVDPYILGGVLISWQDNVLDLTFKTQLEKVLS